MQHGSSSIRSASNKSYQRYLTKAKKIARLVNNGHSFEDCVRRVTDGMDSGYVTIVKNLAQKILDNSDLDENLEPESLELDEATKKLTAHWLEDNVTGVDAAKRKRSAQGPYYAKQKPAEKSAVIWRVASSFFWRPKNSPGEYAEWVKASLTKMGFTVNIIGSGAEDYIPFRGGAPVFKQNHYWADLTIEGSLPTFDNKLGEDTSSTETDPEVLKRANLIVSQAKLSNAPLKYVIRSHLSGTSDKNTRIINLVHQLVDQAGGINALRGIEPESGENLEKIKGPLIIKRKKARAEEVPFYWRYNTEASMRGRSLRNPLCWVTNPDEADIFDSAADAQEVVNDFAWVEVDLVRPSDLNTSVVSLGYSHKKPQKDNSVDRETEQLAENLLRSFRKFANITESTDLKEDWGSSDWTAAIDYMKSVLKELGSVNPENIESAAHDTAEMYYQEMGYDYPDDATDNIISMYMRRSGFDKMLADPFEDDDTNVNEQKSVESKKLATALTEMCKLAGLPLKG